MIHFGSIASFWTTGLSLFLIIPFILGDFDPFRSNNSQHRARSTHLYTTNAIRNEIHNRDNIFYNDGIPITIPILGCILKRRKMIEYKNGIYYVFFKINGPPFPYVKTREYNMILNVFNVVSSIYDKQKPKGRKRFLNYLFVLKRILIKLGKIKHKYIYHH